VEKCVVHATLIVIIVLGCRMDSVIIVLKIYTYTMGAVLHLVQMVLIKIAKNVYHVQIIVRFVTLLRVQNVYMELEGFLGKYMI